MQKIKYITNRELLIEIHNSKNSYCSFSAPEFANFDVIVASLDDVTPDLMRTVLETKANKLSSKTLTVDPASLKETDVVIRLMSDHHLPPETDEKRRRLSSKGEWVVKTNFPPFQHYVLRDGVPIEVGRSHWSGGMEEGKFNIGLGTMSKRLANMFILLVERYSRGGSWRNYCVDEATEALTQRGWLTMHEINEDDIILSYDAGYLKWSKIKSIFRNDYAGKMFRLTVTGMDALVTPGHKFVTEDGLKEVERLTDADRLVLLGKPVEAVSGHSAPTAAVTEGPLPSMPFILTLAQAQREHLIDAMLGGAGWEHYTARKFTKADKGQRDVFSALCTLAGYRTETHADTVTVFLDRLDQHRRCWVEMVDFHGARTDKQPTVDYRGNIWCPQTEYGSFMARRNGCVYLTGNTYLDEMRSHALVQLAQVGLQFNEARSENPFSFYTQIIKNSFRRQLNLERRHQDIRDDLLIMSGAMPSYTRQVDNEIEQRDQAEGGEGERTSKRGRKPKKLERE